MRIAACGLETRLAEKKEVAITVSHGSNDLPGFYHLLTTTARRQGVTFYPLDYYQTLLDSFGPGGDIAILTATHDEDVLASLLLVFCHDTAFYLFGGTADEKRDYMANYLLHYQAMQLAANRGCAWYDFWGIALPGDPLADKWAGISKFKSGFAGTLIEYPAAWHKVYRPFNYLLFHGFPIIRKFLSRLRIR